MKCDWVKNNATLYIYDELEDADRFALEHHLGECAECRAEVDSHREILSLMAQREMPEPSLTMLSASRMRLQESLEHEKPLRWWRNIPFDLVGWMHQAKLSPALAAALLLSGFLSGTFATYKIASNSNDAKNVASVGDISPSQASIAGVRGIVQDPSTNNVRIQYDTLTPRTVQGTLDDPQIQQLLLYATRSNYNSGVHVDSIDLLARKSDDLRIREALMYALHYDKNPGVRLKALSGLQPYVGSDVRVRDAVLEALIHDSNPGVRSEAIGMLSPVGADTSVRETLHQLANQDDDESIKLQSRRVLASLPDVQ